MNATPAARTGHVHCRRRRQRNVPSVHRHGAMALAAPSPPSLQSARRTAPAGHTHRHRRPSDDPCNLDHQPFLPTCKFDHTFRRMYDERRRLPPPHMAPPPPHVTQLQISEKIPLVARQESVAVSHVVATAPCGVAAWRTNGTFRSCTRTWPVRAAGVAFIHANRTVLEYPRSRARQSRAP